MDEVTSYSAMAAAVTWLECSDEDGPGKFRLGEMAKATYVMLRSQRWASLRGFQARGCHDHVTEHLFLIVFMYHVSTQNKL